MKKRAFRLLSCILIFLITGCTTTYVKSDFPSEADFIRKINQASGSADIIGTNDSMTTVKNLKVEKDSVKWMTLYSQAVNDSSPDGYYGPLSRRIIAAGVSLNDVKAISVTDHWGGNILTGAVTGMLAGGVLSYFLVQWGAESNSGYHVDDPPSFIPGMFGGLLLGSVMGIIAGKDRVYILDDSFTTESMSKFNSRHKFGLKIGRSSGFDYVVKKLSGHNEGLARIKNSEGIPGPMISLLYNYAYSRQLSINSELSFISTGSNALVSVLIPKDIHKPVSVADLAGGRSDEKNNVIELAAIGRLNLFRTRISPYILLGPRLDVVFPGESGIVSFLSNLKNQYDTQGIGLSSKYRRFVIGATFGGGLSTGNLLPVELLIEAKYSYDITPRFEMHYDIPAGAGFYNSWYFWDAGNQKMLYRGHEFQINIGAAVF